MSKPPKEYKIKIIITDEQGVEIERNFGYGAFRNWSGTIDDMINSFNEAEKI
ncbi:hypothetical protein M0R04_13730 [Candidatus Dojkabacteria bacterium]|jgi:hypothetical protein|nr:hypothetical protein [Candidatus Dojkabacteria bacterium]